MRESIYALAFTVNLKNSVLEEHNVPEECRPSALQRIEVTVTGFLCAFCQLFVASLLLQEFVRDGIHERNSNFLAYIRGQTDSEPAEKTGESADDGDEDSEPLKFEAKSIIIVKFIAAMLFHFKFEREIRSGMQIMKFVSLHSEMFQSAILAFSMGFINVVAIMLIEVVMIWQLTEIEEGSVN